MASMSRTTGAAIDGLDSIKESLDEIIKTPIGTRVGRRDFGSQVPDLIDKPMDAPNILRIYAASALAITRLEDRVRLRRVSLTAGATPGAATLNIVADRTDIAPAAARVSVALSL